jgi:hypothetical protein
MGTVSSLAQAVNGIMLNIYTQLIPKLDVEGSEGMSDQRVGLEMQR